MFSSHSSTPQFAVELQLGPPSVARMTYVFPGSDASIGARFSRVIAVGVPPLAMSPPSSVSNVVAVGPAVPAGASPRRSGATSIPGAQPLSRGSGNTAAPTLARGPRLTTSEPSTVTTVRHLPSFCMLAERSRTK